jgi:hypothetical protein
LVTQDAKKREIEEKASVENLNKQKQPEERKTVLLSLE